MTLGANATRRYGFHPAIILAALLAMAAVAISILLCYGLAHQLARVIGKTGMILMVETLIVSSGLHWCPDYVERH